MGYRAHYASCTNYDDFRMAVWTVTSNCLIEMLAFGILWWLFVVSAEGDNFQEVKTAVQIDSIKKAATFIALVNSMRSIIKSTSEVLEHRKYTMNEFSEFAPAAQVMGSAFLPQDESGILGTFYL